MATVCGEPPLQQQPSTFGFSCGGAVVFRGVRWKGWGGSTATATGTLWLEGGCVAKCAAAPVYWYSVRIVASQIALCPRSRRVYGLVTARLAAPDFRGERTLRNRLVSCV